MGLLSTKRTAPACERPEQGRTPRGHNRERTSQGVTSHTLGASHFTIPDLLSPIKINTYIQYIYIYIIETCSRDDCVDLCRKRHAQSGHLVAMAARKSLRPGKFNPWRPVESASKAKHPNGHVQDVADYSRENTHHSPKIPKRVPIAIQTI